MTWLKGKKGEKAHLGYNVSFILMTFLIPFFMYLIMYLLVQTVHK